MNTFKKDLETTTEYLILPQVSIFYQGYDSPNF